jgi:hypothetical protein
MECARCKQIIPEGESCNYLGKILCEDCYIQAVDPPKTCDVAAVHSAKAQRSLYGQTGTDGLTELQKRIYEFVCKNGRATKQELCLEFNLTSFEMDKQMAIFRHCELLKGRKIENEVYIVPFELE